MTSVTFRFYAELNDLLPEYHRFKDIKEGFKGRQSVKHLIESLGIPHTEVDLILANSHPIDFSYIPREHDHISVYPVFETFNIANLSTLRPQPLREPKFVLDGHLGRLAAYLRMLGFDTLYQNNYMDEELADISVNKNRILLTRDRGLLKRSKVTRGFLLKTMDPRQQLLSVVWRFDLLDRILPFSRCIACNGIFEAVDKLEISDQLESKTRKYFEKFKRCKECGKIYWKGSHHSRMLALIEWMMEKSGCE